MVRDKLGKASEAIASLRKVVELQPNSAEAHLNLGIALADSYRLEDALAEFSKAQSVAPATAATHYNVGRVLVDLRRYDEARPQLADACRLAPDYPTSYYLLALADTRTQHPAEAVEALRRLTRLQPRNADVFFLLGQNLRTLGKTQEAIAAWKQAADLDPKQTEAMYNLFREVQKTNPDEAKIYRDRFKAMQQQKQATTQAETLGNFALASANRGDYSQAVSSFMTLSTSAVNAGPLPISIKTSVLSNVSREMLSTESRIFLPPNR